MARRGRGGRWTCRTLGDADWLDTLLRGACAVNVVVCGRPLFSSPFGWGPRRIPSHILWLVNGGACEFRIGAEQRRLGPGSLIWVMPGVEHEVYARAEMLPTDACNVNFTVMQGEAALRLSDDVVQVGEASRFRPHAMLAVHEIEAVGPYHDSRTRAALAVLCGSVLAAWRNPAGDKLVFGGALRARVVEWVQKHIHEPITSADLARRFELSQDYFSRMFRRTFGVSPREWIVQERLRQGAKFLAQTRRSVTWIAERLGYQSVHLFCRQFRRAYTCSPTEYRREQ
ncbi:MAG: helix-turn-helix domain-containing protein [Kiritimatiellae bacterium]|nr:helix-turn-helix domain-containing protein [Kiritimatiellia bacterium]